MVDQLICAGRGIIAANLSKSSLHRQRAVAVADLPLPAPRFGDEKCRGRKR
jgi:hypothetical protein